MELCNDVYQIILKNADETTLLVCKFVCKQFLLWVNSLNPKLSWNIGDIIDNNYHRLYKNWIIPTIGKWKRSFSNVSGNIGYRIGKAHNYEFLELFKEHIPVKDIMWGAMESGNLQYIQHLCKYEDVSYDDIAFDFTSVLIGRSIECIKYLRNKFRRLRNLTELDYSNIDLTEGSKGDDPLQFVSYLLKTFPKSNRHTLLTNIAANNSKLILPLKKQGCVFDFYCILSAVRVNNTQSIEIIDDNFNIDKSEELKVISLNAYNILKSRGYTIHMEDSMITAISSPNIDLIKALLEDGYILREEVVVSSLGNLTDTSGLQYLIDQGLHITSNIYELAYNEELYLTPSVIWFLHNNGVPWTNMSARFVALTNDIEFIKSIISAGCQIPTNLLSTDIYREELLASTFQYLVDIGCVCDEETLTNILEYECFELIPLATANMEITIGHIRNIVEEGYIDILETLVETYTSQCIRKYLENN